MADLGEKQRVKRKRRRPDSNRGWRICKTESQAENAGDYAHSADSAAPGAAVDPANAPTDPDLRLIVERWDDLPEPIKAGILAMIRAAGG